MRLSKLSMFYLVGYLVPAGVMLMLAPRLVFTLMFSTQPEAYGDVMPRVAGALTLALGMLAAQILRLDLKALHPTLVGVRVMLVSTWIWLYTRTGDRFFLVLATVVAFGALLTAAGIVADRKRA